MQATMFGRKPKRKPTAGNLALQSKRLNAKSGGPTNRSGQPKSGNSIGQKLDLTVADEGLLQSLRSSVSATPEDQRKGVNRAARLLLALGPEQAAHILQQMEPAEIERVMTEMSRIDHITAQEKKEILAEFEEQARDFEAPVRGGIDEARRFLEAGLGQQAAHDILGRLSRQDLYRDFAFLEKLDAHVLASALHQEHTQIAAVALSFLKPRIAAQVMRHLPEEFRAEVALRIARTARIHPEAVQRVARVLREKFEKRAAEIYSEVGGAETLANILNYMDRQEEDDILGMLGSSEPDIFEDVKERLYTFEELTGLDSKEMRLLIARVDDDSLLATALRGAQEDVRRHFFNSMSQNRAADILEEMDHRGPLTVREINDARTFVLNIARRLDEEGTILIKKEKEEYI